MLQQADTHSSQLYPTLTSCVGRGVARPGILSMNFLRSVWRYSKTCSACCEMLGCCGPHTQRANAWDYQVEDRLSLLLDMLNTQQPTDSPQLNHSALLAGKMLRGVAECCKVLVDGRLLHNVI